MLGAMGLWPVAETGGRNALFTGVGLPRPYLIRKLS